MRTVVGIYSLCKRELKIKSGNILGHPGDPAIENLPANLGHGFSLWAEEIPHACCKY